MTTSKIEIVITTKGQRQVIRGMNSIGLAAAKSGNQTTKATGRMSRGLNSAALRARSVSRYFQRMEGTIRRTSSAVGPFTARLRAMQGALIIPPGGLSSIRTAGRSLRGLLGIFATFYTARIGVELSDSFTRIGNTLKGFGASERDLGRLRKRITEISLAARVSSQETATLFGRFSLATKGLGLTEEDVLDVTETVNKALRLSGSSSLEASQSVRQLSQAFNKGKLDGDEFRSVMENAPIIVKLLSKELGVNKKALFDMARAGKISTAILVGALRKGKVDIDKLFDKLDVTFGDTLQNLKTKAVDFIGSINSRTGAGAGMIKFLEFVGDHLKEILKTLIAIAAVRVGSSVINSLGVGQTAAQAGFARSARGRTKDTIATIRKQGAPGSLSSKALVASNLALATGTVSLATKKATKQSNLLLVPFQKLWGLLKRIASGPLRAMVSIFRTLVSAARFLTGPLGLILVAVTAIVAKFGGGFFSRLQDITGATSKWAAATKALGQSWRVFIRYMQASLPTLFSPFVAGFKVLGVVVNRFLNLMVGGLQAAGQVIVQFVADTIRNIMPLLKLLEGLQAQFGFKIMLAPGIELPDTADLKAKADQMAPALGNASGTIAAPSYLKQFADRATENIKAFEEMGGFGGLGEVGGFLADWGAQLADGFRENLREQELRDAYGDVFNDMATAADSLAGLVEKNRDLIGSELGKGEILSTEEFEAVGRQLETLKKRFATDQIGPAELREKEFVSLNKAKFAAQRVTEFLTEARSALEAFTSVAEKTGTSKDDLQQAVKRLETEFKEAAEKLPPEFRKAAIEGANQMVAEAKTILDAGFGQIGASARAAFLQGLGGSIGSLLKQVGEGREEFGREGVIPPSKFGTEERTRAIDAVKQSNQELTDGLKAQGAVYDGLTAKISKFADAGASQFKQLSQGASRGANEIQNFFESAFGSLEDALVGFVTTGEFDFKKLMNAILADLARLIVRMLIIKPLMSLLGGFFGFAQGGRVPNRLPSFANGGTVQKFAPGGTVMPRFGSSTSDSIPIMASAGEGILSRAAMRRNPIAFNQMVHGKKVQRRVGGGGGVAVTYAPVINIAGGPEGGGGEQQGQEIQAVIERGFMELLGREMRPNGALEGLSRREFA